MISIIIPYYGDDLKRQEALGLLLRTLSMQDSTENNEVILVYQGAEEVFKRMQPLLLSVVDKFIFLERADEPFNKSWCINVAVRQCRCGFFAVVDVDTIFGLDYIRLLYYYSQLSSFCIGWTNLIHSPGKDQPYYRHVSPITTEAAGGVFSFNKDFFINHVGMMNENYEGYGGEDNDLFYRAQYILVTNNSAIFYVPYALLHYYHDWAPANIGNVELMEKTKNNIPEVIKRLKHARLGDIKAPTKIDMFDLEVIKV